MFERKSKLKLGFKDDAKLRYDLIIPKNATMETLVSSLTPAGPYQVHCLYDNFCFMEKIADVSKYGIQKTYAYDRYKDLKITDCWVEFSPKAIGYILYFLTEEEDLSEPTFPERLSRYVSKNQAKVVLYSIGLGVILMAIITIGFSAIALMAAFIALLYLISFAISTSAANAKLKRFTKIYARARRCDR